MQGLIGGSIHNICGEEKKKMLEKIFKRCSESIVIKTGLVVILAYFLANARISGVLSTIGISFAGAVSPLYGTAVLCGTLLSYLMGGLVSEGLVNLIALLLIVAVRWFFVKRISAGGAAVIVTATLLCVMSVHSFLFDTTVFNILIQVAISGFTGISTYFIYLVIKDYRDRKKLNISGAGGYALAVVYSVLIMSLCSVSIFVMNLGIVFSSFIILMSAQRFMRTGGVILGALTTLGAVLCDVGLGLYTVFFSIIGLLTGFFANFSATFIAVSFFILNALGQLVLGVNTHTFSVLADIAVGCVLFIVLPTDYFCSCLEDENEIINTNIRKLANQRMNFVRSSISRVRKNSENLSQMLRNREQRANIPAEVTDNICRKCRSRLLCWETNYDDTKKGFEVLKSKRNINSSVVQKAVVQCTRPLELADTFNEVIAQTSRKRTEISKLREMQGVLYGGLEISEELISEITTKITEDVKYKPDVIRKVNLILVKNRIECETVTAYSIYDRLYIEIYFTENTFIYEEKKLAELLSFELDRDFSYIDTVYAEGNCRLVIAESAEYGIEYAIFGHSAVRGEVSGDTAEVFYDELGNAYAVISDGMGSGDGAAIQSKLLLSQFKRLIKSGIGNIQLVIKMVNMLMRIKSKEETFATLDACRVDLNTGEVSLLKFGAAATLIWREGELDIINKESFPVGIANNIPNFGEIKPEFSPGDLLIMLSDGVNEGEYEYIKQLLSTASYTSFDDLAKKICDKAKGISKDDITCIVVSVTATA
ncbi:MAG: SpoIIE family protein phosphatase [Ruminococcus sp.]|jgi:stage II sporulation protein E|nr:SpoIIE family protein phosphatase [Ruminococcus sp.]